MADTKYLDLNGLGKVFSLIKGDLAKKLDSERATDFVLHTEVDSSSNSADKTQTLTVGDKSITALTKDALNGYALEGAITTAINNLKGGVSTDYDTLKKLEEAIKAEVSRATTEEGKKADKTAAIGSAEKETGTGNILFKNVNGTTVYTLEVADFVKDGMLDKVEPSEDGKKLIFTFNTVGGNKTHTDIELEISKIFDSSKYYESKEVDELIKGVEGKITALDVSALTKRVGDLESWESSHKTEYGDLNTSVTGLSDKINTINNKTVVTEITGTTATANATGVSIPFKTNTIGGATATSKNIAIPVVSTTAAGILTAAQFNEIKNDITTLQGNTWTPFTDTEIEGAYTSAKAATTA